MYPYICSRLISTAYDHAFRIAAFQKDRVATILCEHIRALDIKADDV